MESLVRYIRCELDRRTVATRDRRCEVELKGVEREVIIHTNRGYIRQITVLPLNRLFREGALFLQRAYSEIADCLRYHPCQHHLSADNRNTRLYELKLSLVGGRHVVFPYLCCRWGRSAASAYLQRSPK